MSAIAPGTTAEQLHRAGVAKRHKRCGLAHRHRCVGRLQADHVIEKQWLRNWIADRRRRGEAIACPRCEGGGVVFLRGGGLPPEPEGCEDCEATGEASFEIAVADSRNGWMLCEVAHSAKWQLGIRRDELPPSVEDFALDFDCEHYLDRHFEGTR